jgi:hypothetical protein
MEKFQTNIVISCNPQQNCDLLIKKFCTMVGRFGWIEEILSVLEIAKKNAKIILD